MPIQLRRAYLEAIRARYQSAPKKGKGAILDEYAIRILTGRVEPRKTKPGPKPKYTTAIVEHLVTLWIGMGRLCSKKMKAALPLYLPFYVASAEAKRLLLSMSPLGPLA
jgi:hypothetical protein